MRTIQEKYNAILEGKFSKSQFVKDAKRELPQFLSPYNGYEDTVSILKNKGVIFEAKKKEVPEYDIPGRKYSDEVLRRGVDYELEAMGLMSQESISEKDFLKAEKKAIKNLDKDPNHYLHLLSGDSKKVDKHDQMVPVKKNNHVDTFNGLKKAELNEAKELLKEGKIEDLAKKLNVSVEALKAAMEKIKKGEMTAANAAAKKAKFSEEVDESASKKLEMIRQHLHKKFTDPNNPNNKVIDDDMIDGFFSVAPDNILDMDMEEIEHEYDLYVDANYDSIDEKKGKDHDGDGDIDGDDYMAAKDKAIKKAIGKEVNEGRRRKMKGGKVVTENDYETGGYVESMGPMLEKAMKQLEAVWEEWKAGPATEAAMVPHAKKDLVSYLESRITVGEDIVEDTVEEHQELKEAFKAIISKVLQEEVITEAATGNLSKMASQYNDFEGFQAAINDLENIVTDVESYYAKTKDKIQKVYDSFKDIKNAEGLAVGAMLGPAIESAFRKDLIPVTEKGFTKGLEMPKVKMLETDGIEEEELEEKETVFKPINEALNAPLEKIGREIYNKFEKAGAFKIKAVTSNPGSLDKYMNPVRKDSSLVAIVGDNTQLYVYTHLDNLQLVQDIIKDLDIKNSIKDAGDDGVYFKSKKPGAIASNGLVVVSLGSGDKVVGENKKYKYTKRQK